MPKKKLTKTQVKKKLQTAVAALYDLYIDKFGHGSASFVPMSANKLQEIYANVIKARLQVMRK